VSQEALSNKCSNLEVAAQDRYLFLKQFIQNLRESGMERTNCNIAEMNLKQVEERNRESLTNGSKLRSLKGWKANYIT
jgi:hypothetical protein